MKVIGLLGSAREDGNGAAIATRFIQTATRLGAETRTVFLNRLSYSGCRGCCACKTTLDRCERKDDLTEVLEAMREADAIVLSSPIYFGEIAGRVKSLVDRLFSFMTPDYLTNAKPSRIAKQKKVVLILTQGAPEENLFAEVPKRYQDILRRVLNASEVRLIRACGVGSGGIPKDVPEKFLLQAEKTAREILTAAT